MKDEKFDYYWDDDGKKMQKNNSMPKRTEQKLVPGVIAVGIQQVGDKILVKANMPGFSNIEMNFVIEDGMIKMIGKKHSKKVKKGKGFYMEEYTSNEVFHGIPMPKEIDVKDVKVNKKRGVLEVLLRKKKKEEKN